MKDYQVALVKQLAANLRQYRGDEQRHLLKVGACFLFCSDVACEDSRHQVPWRTLPWHPTITPAAASADFRGL